MTIDVPQAAGVNRTGLFVAIEGGDGAGKGGVIRALDQGLRAAGHDVVLTREPGGTPEGERLRALLLAEGGPAWQPEAELLLMTAARIQHVSGVIRPALAAGRIVVCDRFVGSTLAYQGAGRGQDIDRILRLHRDFVDDFWPDLTLVLDVSPEVGLERSRVRLAQAGEDEGRFEALENGFHARVRASFLQQAADHPDRYATIDAHVPAVEVQAQALDCVLTAITHRKGR